jgi:hypothetical protein
MIPFFAPDSFPNIRFLGNLGDMRLVRPSNQFRLLQYSSLIKVYTNNFALSMLHMPAVSGP